MKKLLIISFLFVQTICFSQNYNTKQLETIAKIWGECYLFHPSVVRSDQAVNWEEELVNFLPLLNNNLSKKEFIKLINTKLLSNLNDPLTCVQTNNSELSNNLNKTNFKTTANYDYFNISVEKLMSDNWVEFDSIISDKNSQKPLVLDLRISSALNLNPHKKTYFERFASMLTETPLSLGSSVSREHFGWDEFNDWWYYEQRWKIANEGILNPLKIDAQKIQYQYPQYDLNAITSIKRPVYLIVNKGFISYYNALLKALKLNRPDTYIIFENTGKVYAPWYSHLIKNDLDSFEFILNPTVSIDDNSSIIDFNTISNNIDSSNINKIIESCHILEKMDNSHYSFNIVQNPYPVSESPLTIEERILGIIKTWTIVKYFYVHHELSSVKWNNILKDYLVKAQKCTNDKEYYELIQNMMSNLNDSHVSTFHPSILDYSKLFVAPIQFEWIENKVIITSFKPDIKENFDIKVGDEIIRIDEKSIQQIIIDNRQLVSASNDQSFYNSVISPGNFVGALDIPLKITIKRNNNEQKLIIPRSIHIFQFMGIGDNRPAFEVKEGNIGYLNLSALTDSWDLETQLQKMQNTEGLILDLRNGYPTDDYANFIKLLTTKPINGRIEKTPIVFANKNKCQIFEKSQNQYLPDSSFVYTNPIAVLIDKSMISRPEDIALELKQIEHVFFFGEQTQGTDGEMTKISLPGGGETSFTGQMIKFANGDQFQGIGIIPDYKVEKSIQGVKEGKDEILDKAFILLSKKISEK